MSLAIKTLYFLTSNYRSHFIPQFLRIDPSLSGNSPSASVIAHTMCSVWHALLVLFLSESSHFQDQFEVQLHCRSSFAVSDSPDLDFLLHTAVTMHAAWNRKYIFIRAFSEGTM